MPQPDDESAVMIVCQGKPRCDLSGDAAIANQVAGCPWCIRHYIDCNGVEWTSAPGNA